MKYIAFTIMTISAIACLGLLTLSISSFTASRDAGFIFSGLTALVSCLVNIYLFRRYAEELGWDK